MLVHLHLPAGKRLVMIKKILSYRLPSLQKTVLCFGLLMALSTTGAFAQFAVSEDFRGSGNPDIIIGDNAILTSGNGDPVNGGWLRLTNASGNRKGYAFVDKSFPSTLGVLVDFEYKTWRSTSDGYDGADGIGVFLFDGAYDQSNFGLGGYGGSLGYAPNTVAGTTTGLRGGYVGIGLDEYGNFSNNTEGRNGGSGLRPNSVVLRGPTTANAGTTNQYLSGTTITTTDGVNFNYLTPASTGNATQNALDYNTLTTTRPTDAQFFRRVQIEIERLTTGGQYKITVRWKTTPTGAFTDITSYTTTDVPPSLLKLGFAAATGGGYNNHEIRNLLVTTPNNMRVKKTANKDFLRTIPGGSNDNMITYTIEVTNDTDFAVPNIDFVDRITDVDGNLLPKYDASLQPNGFEIVSAVATGFTTGTPVISASSNTITGTFSMAATSTGIITVVGRLRGYTPAGSRVINTATATPPYDDDLNNNTSTVITPVLAEGIDFVPTHTVDENCADGSNTFTVNVANIGATNASVGTNNNSNRLYLVIRVPRTSQGYTYTVNTMAGWEYFFYDDNTDNNTRTYYYRSNQWATMSSGSAYNYPFVYTLTKNTPYAAYDTRATVAYAFSNGTNAESGSTGNNTEDVSIVVIPAAPAAPNVYYCQGGSAVPLTATATGSNTLKWYFAATGGFGSDYAPTPVTETPGIVNYWVTQTNGSCESPRRMINVYVTPTPTPGSIAANQTLCNPGGDPALLTSVTPGTIGSATGLTLVQSYKWQISANNTTWDDIANTNLATYDPPAITATTYYRRITLSTNTTNSGTYICQSAPSNVITVAVLDIPTGGVISGPGRVCYGGSAVLNNGLNGGASTANYQWQSSATGGPGFNWVDIPGATDATHTTGPLTARTWFRRLAVNSCGSGTTGDINVEVTTVNPGSLGAAKTICYNTSPGTLGSGAGTSNGSSSAGGITYRWESAPGATGGTFAAIAGETGATYTPGNLTQTFRYRRFSTNVPDGVTCSQFTEILVTVQSRPQPGSITGPSNTTVCSGATVTIGSGGAGTGDNPTVTYRWESAPVSTGIYTTITGQAGPTLTVAVTTPTRFRRYTVSTVNGVGCESIATNVITITINTTAVDAGQIGTSQVVCYNTQPPTIVNQTSGTNAYNYLWQYSTDGTTWITNSSQVSANYFFSAPITVTTYYRRFGVRDCPGTTPSNVVTMTVPAVPSAGSIGSNQTVCQGYQPAVLTSVTPGAGTGYQWQESNNNGSGASDWTNIPGATSETYLPPITYSKYYRRLTLYSTSCTTPSNSVFVAVGDNITAGPISKDQTVCSNQTPDALNYSNGGSGWAGSTGAYRWDYSTNGTTWFTTGTTTEFYTFSGPLAVTTYYRRATVGTTCTGEKYANPITITVTPAPAGGTASANQNICNGTAPTALTVTGSGTGTYRWEMSTVSATGPWSNATGTFNGASYSPGTLVTTTYFRRATIGGSCGSEGYSNTVTITVSPVVNGGTASANQYVCSGAPANNLSVSSGSTGTYRWEMSTTSATGPWANAAGTFNGAGYSPGTLVETTYYRRVTTSGSCVGYSNTVTITVAVVTAGTLNGNQNICMDTVPAVLGSATAATGPGTLTYRWESSLNGSTGWTVIAGADGPAYQPPALKKTTYYRRTTISTSTVSGNTATCESAPTPAAAVTTRNCKVITNPMIYQKVKS